MSVRKKLSPDERRIVCALSHVDERTLARWERNPNGSRSSSTARIESAIARLPHARHVLDGVPAESEGPRGGAS